MEDLKPLKKRRWTIDTNTKGTVLIKSTDFITGRTVDSLTGEPTKKFTFTDGETPEEIKEKLQRNGYDVSNLNIVL